MVKGAIGMPMEVLVGLIVAVLLILGALIILGIVPPFFGSTSDMGYFDSCCTSYNLAQHCGEGAGYLEFNCTVGKDMAKDGWMSITALAGRVGLTPDYCCRK